MRYHFIDKIIRIDLGHEIVAVKGTTVSEDFYADHFVGFPVFPGAQQIEAAAQACGALVEISANYQSFSILLMVEKMKFKRMVRPGDQMLITCTAVSMHPESALFNIKIEVDGATVTTGQVMVGIVTAADGGADYEKAIGTLADYFRPLLRGAVINAPSI